MTLLREHAADPSSLLSLLLRSQDLQGYQDRGIWAKLNLFQPDRATKKEGPSSICPTLRVSRCGRHRMSYLPVGSDVTGSPTCWNPGKDLLGSGCFGNTVILWALSGGDSRASSARDPLVAWQVSTGTKQPRPLLPCPPWCSRISLPVQGACVCSLAAGEDQGGRGAGLQHSAGTWSDAGIEHLPVSKDGISRAELWAQLSICRHIQLSCLIPGEAAACHHGRNKGQCLGRKNFFLPFRGWKCLYLSC